MGILTDSPPLSFIQEDKRQVRGIAVDLAGLIGKVMRADVEYYGMSRPELFEALKAGKIDFISAAVMNDAICKEFDCLEIGISAERQIFACDDCRTVTCMKDLPGHSVVYLRGDAFLPSLQALENVELIEADSPAQALQMVEHQRAEVYISPSHRVAFYLIQKLGLQNVRQVGMPIEKAPFAMMVAKGNSSLLSKLSISYGKLIEKGSVELVFDKWLGKKPAPKLQQKHIKYALFLLAVTVIGILAVGTWNYSLKQKVNKITEDLSLSEQRYRTLIESSPDMIFTLNANGEIVHANEAAKEEALFKDVDSHRYKLHDFVREEDKAAVDSYLEEILANGCAKREILFQYKDSLMSVDAVGTPIKEVCPVTGQPLICCFARDVTERNMMEQELIQSERLAIIGQMAASIAHEINNPLGIVSANAEELVGGDLSPEEFNEVIATIQRNAIQAGKITERLLTLATPKPFREETINLVDVLEESISFLRPKMKKIKLELDFPEEGLWVNGDSRSMQQLFVNLLLNSIDAMEEDREGAIFVRGRVVGEKEERTVRIVVNDNGKGIPRENLPKIFEPFFSPGKQGFGLGLFISRRIVERHDGIIFAESEVGVGTNMIIELKA